MKKLILALAGVLILILLVALLVAGPMWLAWTVFGLGAKFFYWLPDRYWYIGFWEFFGLFVIFGGLRHMAFGMQKSPTTASK